MGYLLVVIAIVCLQTRYESVMFRRAIEKPLKEEFKDIMERMLFR